jgi:elongation factor Ts
MSTKPEQVNVPAQLVKDLRERTGAGFNDCRAALLEAGGDIEKAIDVLRRKGQAAAQKKAQREATEGLIGHYIHAGGKIGVIIEVNCESDFVARTEGFQTVVKDIAMHIAAADPRYATREDVPAEALDKEREIYRAQFADSGKPAAVVDKIVEGKLGAFYAQTVLLDQPYIREPSMTVGQVVSAATAKLGENIVVSRFARFKLGETS